MVEYQLNPDETHAQKIIDGVKTGIWCCVSEHPEYLEWLAEGNSPIPADTPE
jgi:hypothetical protein